jgi:hypothetical protein
VRAKPLGQIAERGGVEEGGNGPRIGSALPRGPERMASSKARCVGLSCSSFNIATRGDGRFLVFFAI